MPKPNQNMTLTEMRSYVRSHKLNHPDVKIKMKRSELIAGLKKAGHWEEVAKKPRGKVPKGSHRMPDGTIMKDKDMPKKKATKSKPDGGGMKAYIDRLKKKEDKLKKGRYAK